MSQPIHQLAQINIARMLAPLDDPIMADFMANLDPINALADSAPGFVWRYQTDSGNATDERPYEDDRIIVNFSVWNDVESLKEFVYRGPHLTYMRRRREWFERLTDAMSALWWVPAGHRPTVAEAVERLDYLRQHGVSSHVFTFRELYPAPESSLADVPTLNEDPCPAT